MVLVGVAVFAAIGLRAAVAGRVPAREGASWTTDRLALMLAVLAVLFISFRSNLFGVDTAAYIVVFESYCTGQSAEQLGLSFYLSSVILNWMMIGACDVRLLPATWVIFMVVAVSIGGGRFSDKLRYLTLLLVSMVGIELTTNALRQGLSVAVLVAAVSWFGRRNAFAIALSILAVSLHSSAALVLGAVGMAALSWRAFLVAVIAGVVTVWGALGAVAALSGPFGSFLYEIQKYLAHEADEVWIRVLSLISLVMILLVPRFFAAADERASVSLHTGKYAAAVKLAATSIPFIMLPYFGYRYIYGVLPVVLWMTVEAVRDTHRLADRTFGLLLTGNLMLLAVWSYGSGYMRSVPFFE